MRQNLPVTDREVHLGDDTLIVSNTDLKGKITYVNREFVQISGYTESELMGAPHNLVRHPDMPPQAFDDLWKTLKAGRPWKGYVKNRCKNGDFYWVEAHVAPVMENNQVTGYLSTRRKAPREMVTLAEEAYRRFRNGEARGQAIRDGWVVSNNPLAKLRARFAQFSIATKLAAGCALSAILVMGASAWMQSRQLATVLDEQGLTDLKQSLQLIRGMVELRAEALGKEVVRLNELFAAEFPDNISVDESADVPVLRHGRQVMNQQTEAVDRFTSNTGAVATLFARKGDAFIRITTSVKKEDGSRAFGTALGAEHPASARLLAGAKYFGKATLFGKDYYTAYVPIFDASKRVIGATFTGLDVTVEINALREKIQKVKVGATGYFYVLDGKPGKSYGTLVVHPAKQGQNILAAKDAGGREFIREMLEKKEGIIYYPWANSELGDTSAREKVVAYASFEPWQWVIGGGTYVHEFESALRASQRFMLTSAVVVVLLLVALIYAMVHFLVRKPLASQVLPVFDRMAEGRFDSALDLARNDEIGRVLQGLEKMQNRMGYQIIESRLAAEQMARIRYALDEVSLPVTLTNEDHKLIYLNHAAEKLWNGMAADLRIGNPDFDVARMLGTRPSAHFGSDAGHVEVAENATDSRVFDVVIARHDVRLTVCPVKDAAGRFLGQVSIWLDRTAEIAVEKEVGDIVHAAAEGDFTQRIALEGKEGFIRQLAEGINILTHTSDSGLSEVARVLEALANGDLTEKITSDYHGAFARLKVDTNSVVDKLAEMVTLIKSSTDSINVAAKEIAAGNSDLSSRTEQQASSLEETASSMEELTSTVKQNAENSTQANALAAGASAVAVKGGQVVSEVVQTMNNINASSKKIEDIISVIDGIAFQTNILALNAAVEAARAGEQGRGFAVVASEVRNLAQRSAAAAKEIKQLIGDSVEKVSAGTRLVDEAGKTMEEIVDSVRRVTDIMADITAASKEQSAGIEEVNHAITQMDEVTQQNAALVEQAAAAAESMEEQSERLTAAVSVFRLTRNSGAIGSKFDFEAATNAHIDWKHRLIEIVRGTGEQLDAETVSLDNKCALGQWIYGPGKRHAGQSEFELLRKAHAGFHRCAGHVVSLANAGKFEEARDVLANDFERESKNTIDRLLAVRRNVERKGPTSSQDRRAA